MRKLILIAALAGLACVAMAVPRPKRLSVATGTNTSGSATIDLAGYVDAVYVGVSDGVSTGTVALSYAPITGSTAVSIATGATADEKIWRPRTDGTAVDGTALTSDPPGRFVLGGETVTFAISGSPTNVTWTCIIMLETAK